MASSECLCQTWFSMSHTIGWAFLSNLLQRLLLLWLQSSRPGVILSRLESRYNASFRVSAPKHNFNRSSISRPIKSETEGLRYKKIEGWCEISGRRFQWSWVYFMPLYAFITRTNSIVGLEPGNPLKYIRDCLTFSYIVYNTCVHLSLTSAPLVNVVNGWPL